MYGLSIKDTPAKENHRPRYHLITILLQAGGDSGIFQTGTDDPSPPCGGTPELGPIDVVSWLDQAEGSGLPSAYANLSVVAEVFQVNRDGGGPMSCEYSEVRNIFSKYVFLFIDYSLTYILFTLECRMLLQPPGNQCSCLSIKLAILVFKIRFEPTKQLS